MKRSLRRKHLEILDLQDYSVIEEMDEIKAEYKSQTGE